MIILMDWQVNQTFPSTKHRNSIRATVEYIAKWSTRIIRWLHQGLIKQKIGGDFVKPWARGFRLWCVVRRSYKLGLFIYGWKKSSFFFEDKIIYTKKGNSLQIYIIYTIHVLSRQYSVYWVFFLKINFRKEYVPSG